MFSFRQENKDSGCLKIGSVQIWRRQPRFRFSKETQGLGFREKVKIDVSRGDLSSGVKIPMSQIILETAYMFRLRLNSSMLR